MVEVDGRVVSLVVVGCVLVLPDWWERVAMKEFSDGEWRENFPMGVEHDHWNCPVQLPLRRRHEGENGIHMASSGGLHPSWRTPIGVGLTCLHDLHLSSQSRIKSIICFFQVPWKRTE